MTRAFRPAFVVAALLALAALIPALAVAGVVGRASRKRWRSSDVAGLGRAERRWRPSASPWPSWPASGCSAGRTSPARPTSATLAEQDPCTAPPDPHPGSGIDAAVQRIALSTLNGAACELGTSRERLVLSLDGNSGYRDVQWDDATMERAMRTGADRAIDDADDRGTIPGFVASILHFAVEHAPLGWIAQRIDLPG